MNLGYSFQSLRQSLSKCPWSTNQASSSFSSPRICRPCSAKRLASARFSLVNLPCLVLASVSRARPSLVLGPVEAPPWSLQRPTGSLAGRWTWRAPAGLGLATNTLPVWAVKPWFGISFHSAQLSSVYGVLLYPILDGFARHA